MLVSDTFAADWGWITTPEQAQYHCAKAQVPAQFTVGDR
jgi:hypothetical protein